jgi:ATP-dependent Clp protease, protease subunit
MPAIRPHETATDTESSWDGPGEVAAAPEEEAVLRYMHAWVDAEADPNTKTAYKFPHHKAGSDTAAVIAGVNNALARLSQADIPAGDRAGVEAHLRSHREDAGLEDETGSEDGAGAEDRAGHAPIRCFEGTAKPHEPFWRWTNKVESDAGDDAAPSGETDEAQPEMELYGYISEYSWMDDDVTPKMFKNDLYLHGGGGPVKIRMNSYGGDVIAASLMSTIIRDYPGKVTVQIDGIAASAATVVAMAGDILRMQETAYFMIHDPMAVFFLASLNISELSRMADSLAAVKEGIVNAYERKTGLSRTRLAKMMTDETWMDARKAVDLGFVDEIIGPKGENGKRGKGEGGNGEGLAGMANKAAVVNALRNYRNLPEPLRALLQPGATDIRQTAMVLPDENNEAMEINHEAIEILRAEVKFLKKE